VLYFIIIEKQLNNSLASSILCMILFPPALLWKMMVAIAFVSFHCWAYHYNPVLFHWGRQSLLCSHSPGTGSDYPSLCPGLATPLLLLTINCIICIMLGGAWSLI